MRDILVHSTRYDAWSNSTQYAAQLAARLKASLTGVWCHPPTDAVVAGDVGAMVALAAAAPNPALEAAAKAATSFRNWASSLGVAHSDWLVCEADASVALRQIGHWHDLIVLGAGQDQPWGSEPALAEILVTSQLPCLIVPESRLAAPRFDRIAVAWNGSTAALRAMHAALPLLAQAGHVVVLVGGKSGLPPIQSRLANFDLDRYCERHGLAVERVRLNPSEDRTGATLLHAALTVNTDLLVMGAFGRTRLSEWILGGVSRHMLGHSPIPMLMRH